MEASLPEGSPELQHSGAPPDSHALFDRLPANVIERILFAADANTFASLALLSQKWKHASDTPELYAHHLSRCPSFSWTHGANSTAETESLADLKRLFIKEIRQNAYDVFLRPRQTLVRLISSSMSSSTAFPQGEVFRFSFSANGQIVLCISSSRIVILDVASDPVTVKHELQTRRRPLGATVRDDGSLIAVLSSTHRVHIYQLSDDEAKHIQVITLNDAPRDIAFSPTGSVLALAFEDSIEVYAVGEDAKPTDRRAVRCLRVDGLSFSPDGSMLLGSSTDCERDGVVTITAPFYTETGTDASPEELHMRMWTTQILFPEIRRACTHACLIAGHEDADENWVIGYDSQLAAFKALRLNDVNAGVVYFASPFFADETREMRPSMGPATDDAGELIALGFQDSALWIYGVPSRLDLTPSTTGTQNELTGTQVGGIHHCGGRPPRDNLAQLQKIIQQPKILIRGRRVADMKGVTSAHWVRATDSTSETRRHRRRLVAVAPGGVRPQIFGEEDIPVDGGRVLLLDFERCTTNGETIELDIEVGETAPKILMEPDSSMDTEVELERRRTRLHRGDTDTTFASASHRRLVAAQESRAVPFHFRRFSVASPTSPNDTSRGDVLDLPYDNTQPRSSDVLHRAATAAASTRGRYDPRYRNSPSRRQVPHESDADNWVPPPPPYKQETEVPLPDDLLRTLLPRNMVDAQALNDSANHPGRAQTTRIARPTVSTRPRPQSAILQRLGTITGPRRRGSSIGREDLYFSQQSESPTITAPREQSVNDIPPSTQGPNPHPDTAASLAYNHPAVQSPPTFAVHPAEQTIQENPMPLPYLGASALGDAYFPYSVSSPNLLHIPQPHGDMQETVADDEHEIPQRQRSFRRRVSTEPTSLPPPENEEWRRRIQDWNEHTIKERGRKRRGKCIVM
ncbi:hypothetical protein N7467_009194 [Penicillium canescens]|nr:hypothetical protein N7467_009194 [Penicillium canescens]